LKTSKLEANKSVVMLNKVGRKNLSALTLKISRFLFK